MFLHKEAFQCHVPVRTFSEKYQQIVSYAWPTSTPCILNGAQNWLPTQMVWQPGVTERKWAILQCMWELNEMNKTYCSRRVSCDINSQEAFHLLYAFWWLWNVSHSADTRKKSLLMHWTKDEKGWQSCVEFHLACWDQGLQAAAILSGQLYIKIIILVNIFSNKTLEYANYH